MTYRDLFRPFVAALAALLVVAVPAAANQLEPAQEINIELVDAALTETLLSFAAISGAELDMADGIEGAVTIAAKAKPWTDVLDAVCRTHDLTCEMLAGEPPVLRVRPAEARPAGFAQAINLDLAGADLREVLATFETIAERPVRIDDGVQGTVGVHFRSVPWPRALEEICALSGCRVVWGGQTIVIEQENTEERLLNMSLKDADLGETLRAFASFPLFGATGTRVEIDPTLHGSVTVELKYVTWTQALDLVCGDAGCDWALRYGDPPVLRVVPRGIKEARPASPVDEPGAAAKTLAYRFEPPGGRPLEGVASFTWAEPIHVRPSDGPWRLRLSWIPLGPELSVVLPLLERCEAARSSVVLLDPIVLPVEAATRREAEGAVLTLGPAPEGTPASRLPVKAENACGPERQGDILVTARRPRESDDAPRAERGFKLGGGYLLVTPVDARRPVAAVIALGVGLDGRQGLALLQPGDDGAGVAVETLALAAGESAERVVRSEGRPFELTIENVAPARD